MSRWSSSELAREAMTRGICEQISGITVWRWLSANAIKLWQHRSWIFPRDPGSPSGQARSSISTRGRWENELLHLGDFVICADEKPSIQARRRITATRPARPGEGMKVEHEYERKGALCYLSAWDARRAKIIDRCAPKDGIVPFDALVDQFMSQAPYKQAQRVFVIVDNGSAHRGKRSIDRLQGTWPTLIVVHTPVHARAAILAFATACVVALIAVPVAARVARRTGFLDQPVGYKKHASPTPYLGGSAVVLAFVAVAVTFGAGFGRFLPVVLGAVALWVVGTTDDRVNLSPLLRVGVTIAAAVGLWAGDLGWNVFDRSALDLGLTIVWVVGLVNAFNLMDNLDGATASVAAWGSCGSTSRSRRGSSSETGAACRSASSSPRWRSRRRAWLSWATRPC